jgi:glucose/arabinose dehydrogenase
MGLREIGILAIGLVSISYSLCAAAENFKITNEISARVVAEDLDKAVRITPDPRRGENLLVALRSGLVLSVDPKTGETHELIDIEDITRDDPAPGLLGIAATKDSTTPALFLNYVDTQGDLVVSRFSLSGEKTLRADDMSVVIKIARLAPNNLNGDLTLDNAGNLFVATDDGEPTTGTRSHTAQGLNSLLGKVIKISPTGQKGFSISKDNPFISTPNALPEIWALGFRSPDSINFDAESRRLVLLDSNERTLELNIIEAGKNYGWDKTDGVTCRDASCKGDDFTAPKISLQPTSPRAKLLGGFIYRGSSLSQIQNSIIFAESASGTIYTAREKTPGVWAHKELAKLPNMIISALGTDSRGEIWVATEGGELLGLGQRK